jgi:hypothetical protein
MSGPDLGGNGGGSEPAPQPQTPPPAPAAPAARAGETVGAAASQASAAAGQAASAAAAAMEGMFGSITMAEQFMVAGALLVLVLGEFLFGALLGGGGNFIAAVLASAELILAVWLKNRRTIQWPASYGLILSALVLAVAVPVLDDFLFFLHSLTQAGYNIGGLSGLLADLSNWAGAVLMSWGAVLYWRSGGN